MLFVDSRVGSADILKPLQKAGLSAELTMLPFGDIAFEGKGALGKTVSVGVELKRLSDLQSSLRSGRLSGHQLPGMLGPEGAFDFAWLVIEGQFRTNATGQILAFKGAHRGWRPLPGGMTVGELQKQVLSLEMCGGLHTRYTNSRDDTVQFIGALYHWFTDTALDAHTSHLANHKPSGVLALSKQRQAFCAWPHIGRKLSAAVVDRFGSVRNAANASVDDWAALESTDDKGHARVVGASVAGKIVNFLREE